MSEEKISLDPRVTLATNRWFLARGLSARVLTLTAEVHDLQHRFTAMESRVTALEVAATTRLDAMERRFSVQEERMSAMLALVVRIAERLDARPGTAS